jgi:phosphopantetheinyl transferase
MHYLSPEEVLFQWKTDQAYLACTAFPPAEALACTFLYPDEQEQLASIGAESRQREWLAVRHLLQRILPGARLGYHANGKPYLCGSTLHIGISHASNALAIIISQSGSCAADIETFRPALAGLAKRFVSPWELAHTPATDLRALTLIWCAKEALYKWYGGVSFNFASDLYLLPFAESDGWCTAVAITDGKEAYHRLMFAYLEDLCIVWIV